MQGSNIIFVSALNLWIRERAYELYEGRGREPNQDEQDWLRAEREISS
jgi:hypothetical protein